MFVGKIVECKDHPRLCGEKRRIIPADRLNVGSPPPMRGKDGKYQNLEIIDRITPAYAGKRLSSARYMRYRQDHPRLCGEKHCFLLVYVSSAGSPPPMRGKASSGAAMWNGSRITPAYAGKSSFQIAVT